MMPEADFWRQKKVFLTGHTGFKGGWLALWLHRLGAFVHGFALDPETEPCLFDAAHVSAVLASDVRGDVRDAHALMRAMRDAEPEVVIHMAAQPLVRRSYRDPLATYATNVMGTVHLLEAIRHVGGVSQVLVVTSDKCYENVERKSGYREGEPLGGFDPYASSKACAELATAAWRRSFFEGGRQVGIATARAGNVIGGGDWSEDRLVPDIVRAWRQKQPVVLRNPGAIRPWQHVLEALRGYLLLIERMAQAPEKFSRAWNFGPAEDDARTVEWMVRRFARTWEGGEWEESSMNEPHEARLLILDSALARKELEWQPALDVDEGVDWTAAWYRAHEQGEDMHDFTLAQISQFEMRLPAC